jgi:hypothetical protein
LLLLVEVEAVITVVEVVQVVTDLEAPSCQQAPTLLS